MQPAAVCSLGWMNDSTFQFRGANLISLVFQMSQENKKQKEVAFSFSLHICKFSSGPDYKGNKGLPSQFCSIGTGFPF